MIEKLKANELPWALLLDADPEKEKVLAYLEQGEGIVWKENGETLGVLIFVATKDEFEIMNVAVAPQSQGRGIGGLLLEAAFQQIEEETENQTQVIIRTGSITSAALHLYQKKGFSEISREKDYFIKNYAEPIYEEGILLRDQVTLAKSIQSFR
ncbi:N-acetyltransferase [Enterococcus sp. DIV0660C]|uniref:GNAT family N-acetyltransferase n=1 Tax=Enterococcus sp. DIV0660C TaxID=2230880 RepID=UPI001A8D83AB|nr:N-acetyltransferase [Enterococcus sp. DIV0660C]MBO0430680.1 GNAT family N-acetyltransferase [Enterococcus sp. DIV0660C]